MIRVVSLLGLLGILACTASTDIASTCQQDGDCATGEVCDPNTRACVASSGSGGGTTGGSTTGGGNLLPGPPNADHSQLLLAPVRVAADGASSCEVRVVVRDGNNVLIPAQKVSLSTSGADDTVRPASGSTDNDGTFRASLTSTQIGPRTVTATVAGGFALTASMDFTSGPPSLAQSTWAATSSAPKIANGSAMVGFVLTLNDATGRPAAGQAVTFTATGARNTLTPSAAQTDAAGAVTVTLASQTAETKVVIAHIGSAHLDATATFVPGDPNAETSNFVANPNLSPADGTATVDLSLVVADAQGNPIPALMVTLDGNGTFTPNHGSTNSSGIFSAQVTSTHAETDTITARFGGLALSADVEFVAAPSALHSTFTASPNNLVADNTSLATLTMTLRDGEGVPMADRPIVFSGVGNADTLGSSLVSTNSQGVASTTLRSATPGPRAVTASLGGTFSLSSTVFFRPPACANAPRLPGLPALALGASPNAVLAARFDADAYPDLLVVSNTGAPQIWRGRGDGTFLAAGSKAGSGGAGGAWIGDLVSDPNLDVLIANPLDGTLSVYAGGGGGGLQNAVAYPAGNHPTSLGVADFNGDGKLDAVVANPDDATVSLLLNAGSGNFGLPNAFATQRAPVGVAVGNLDDNPNTDIAAVNNANDTVSVLRGHGDGSFLAAVNIETGGSQPSAVAMADFNGDSFNDLLVANANSNTVTYLQGNGTGFFRVPVPYAVGRRPQALWVADVNGDTYLDAVVVDTVGSDLRVLLGVGDGTFTTRSAFAGDAPLCAAVADFDHDGRVDLVVANHGANALNVLLQTPTGEFPGPAARYPAHDGPADLTTTDLNGDGNLDLIAANAGADLSVILGSADGTMGPTLGYAAHQGPVALAAGDFDEDGRPDVVAANAVSNDVSLLMGVGNGALQARSDYFVGNVPSALVVGDFDADAHLDIAVANYVGNSVTVLLGTGHGTFKQPATYPVGVHPAGIAAGYFDAGSSLDLVVANEGNDNLTLLTNDGHGAFPAGVTSAAGLAPGRLVAGDFTGDGKADVLAISGTPATVVLLAGDGAGAFDAPVQVASTPAPRGLTAADFDADGKLDLAVTNASLAQVALWRGDGSGMFAPLAVYTTGKSPVALTVGDFNRDGRMDLASANQEGDDVGVLVSRGCGP